MPRTIALMLLTGTLVTKPYSPAMAQQPVTLLRPITVLTVDSGGRSSSALIHLRNSGSAAAQVDLSVGEFVNRTTAKGINAKAMLFGPRDSTGAQVLRLDVPPRAVVHVRVEASNLWEAGESEAALLANGDTLGTLRAVKYLVPFNVKLRAGTSDPAEFSFVQGDTLLIDLKNEDGMTYQVAPALWVKGHSQEAESVVLPPNGGGTIRIPPPDAWFRDANFLKPDQADGVLTLRLDPPGTQSVAGWPTKTIPFKARLMSMTPGWQGFWEFAFLLIPLLLGAIASLLTRYWVPNSISRASLKEKLDDLAEKTRMLSAQTSSDIRVGLRVERQRVQQRLKARWTFSPDLPALITQLGERIDELLKHVALTGKVNELCATVDHLYDQSEAPSRVSVIEDEVMAINASLRKVPSSLTELDAIDKRIAATGAKIDLLTSGSDATWHKQLQDRFTLLETERQTLEADWSECKPLFDMWGGGWSKVPEADYDRLDTRISLLMLIREYLTALKLTTATREAAKAFAGALKNFEYRSAREALGEIRSQVFREEVVAALQDPSQRPQIAMSQSTPRQVSQVYFSLQFPAPRLESPEALDPVTCEWSFGDSTAPERGWLVAHYFAGVRNYEVSATFQHQGKPVKDQGDQPVKIVRNVTVQTPDPQEHRRTHAEWVQLGIVVLVALLGLMAGARDQLAKLDLVPAMVALFLLGFGADAIKNALTPPKATTP
jgi:hypothetical protein